MNAPAPFRLKDPRRVDKQTDALLRELLITRLARVLQGAVVVRQQADIPRVVQEDLSSPAICQVRPEDHKQLQSACVARCPGSSSPLRSPSLRALS
jgi:hypothetical protein